MMRRIFHVDDHPVVRQGLRLLIEQEPDLRMCGEAADVPEALEGVEHFAPDLVVTDLTLEVGNGLDLTRALRRHHPALPILVLSMHDEQLYAERALSAGACGYVMKCCSGNELIEAVREVLAGRIYVSSALRHLQPDYFHDGHHNRRAPLDALTDRELEIFLLIGQGYAPRHIAEKLGLSVSTVEVYRERLKDKLRLESSPLLLRYAVSWCKDEIGA